MFCRGYCPPPQWLEPLLRFQILTTIRVQFYTHLRSTIIPERVCGLQHMNEKDTRVSTTRDTATTSGARMLLQTVFTERKGQGKPPKHPKIHPTAHALPSRPSLKMLSFIASNRTQFKTQEKHINTKSDSDCWHFLTLQLVIPEVEVLLRSARGSRVLVKVLHDGVGDLFDLLLLVFQVFQVRGGILVQPIQRLVDGGFELLEW